VGECFKLADCVVVIHVDLFFPVFHARKLCT